MTRPIDNCTVRKAFPALAIVVAAACRGDAIREPTAPPTAAVVDVTPAVDTLVVTGRTVQLTATPRDAAGNPLSGREITWSSSPPDVATVDAFGLVTANRPGSAIISASADGTTGSAEITVALVIATIRVSPESTGLFVGGARQLSAALADSAGFVFSGPTVTWTSLDPAVAMAAGGGLVTGVGVGSVDVVAAAGGRSDTVPIAVSFRRYTAMRAGGFHTCGLTTTGTVECWGLGVEGQLGNDSTAARAFPSEVSNAPAFSLVATGAYHTCAISDPGAGAYCWGANGDGRLGNGSSIGPARCVGPCSRIPTPVAGGLAFTTLTAGFDFTCGITGTGRAYCWGADRYGQLGSAATSPSPNPDQVSGGLVFAAISAGAEHACGLAPGGSAYCWGRNRSGQLGTGSATGPETCGASPCSTVPVAVAGGLAFASIQAGYAHTCGLTRTGTAYCWGANSEGQLGIGNTADVVAPVPIASRSRFTSLGAGRAHTCGIASDGTLLCWGANDSGQLGFGTDAGPEQCADGPCSTTPVPVTGVTRFATVAAGSGHTCGVALDGRPYCWGASRSGQVGDGTNQRRTVPTAVFGSR